MSFLDDITLAPSVNAFTVMRLSVYNFIHYRPIDVKLSFSFPLALRHISGLLVCLFDRDL
jgi:hypothetical protein